PKTFRTWWPAQSILAWAASSSRACVKARRRHTTSCSTLKTFTPLQQSLQRGFFFCQCRDQRRHTSSASRGATSSQQSCLKERIENQSTRRHACITTPAKISNCSTSCLTAWTAKTLIQVQPKSYATWKQKGKYCPGQCCNSTYSSSKAAAQTHN